jgi:putative acetyltransferase
MFSIRPATAGDTEGVVGVIQAVYEEYGFAWDAAGYHADLYDLRSYYFDRGHRFWVAEQANGQIAGTAALELIDPLPGTPGTAAVVEGTVRLTGCDCALERLYVHPAARRLGIGASLLQTALEEARRHGRRCLEIWSDKRFREAHRLYARFGAEVVADRICHDPDESPEWGLVIRL